MVTNMHVRLKLFASSLTFGPARTVVLFIAVLFTVAWLMNHCKNKNELTPAPAFCPVVGDQAVTRLLKPIRQKFNVPAMAAAVVTSDGVTFIGAAGVRKRGSDVAVGLNDFWHLGSDGKAMTSTLIARLVEQGKLQWDATMAGIFPESAGQMNPDFRQMTLLELLSHRAGLPENVNLAEYQGDDVQALRLRVVQSELAKPPLSTPGTKYAYSNVGYIIAGAIAEKITGQSWEDAISNQVFKPLQMNVTGFGGTGTPRQIDQPWPHTADGNPTAENGPDKDNPPVMGPAGRIHCSIQDWAKFIQDQLRGARGEAGTLLKPASYQKLQTPPFGGHYALGWIVVQRGWAGGNALSHAGDNTMNCADVWIAPNRDFAILVCVNQSGDTAFKAADAAVGAMIDLLKK
jgi:CubicO group peptidase (beta-lactamase class C family)